MRLNIAVGSSVGRSQSLTAERLINLYAEKSPKGAKSNVNLIGVPGLTTFGTAGTVVRGEYKFANTLMVVSGNGLYAVTAAGVATYKGYIDGNGLVSMADNGTQLCIVGGTSGYIYTGGVLAAIADADFPGATSVAYLDGYFIFSTPDSAQFFISALYDGTTYDALDFATAEAEPDHLIRVFVDHREIWLFGAASTEIWYNSGNADFPFTRIDGAIIERGLGAIASPAKVDNSVYWVDDIGIVRRADKGYTPARISTHAIEYAISRGTLADCSGFTYTQEGHEFYALTVPGVGTYVYDAATQLWHERDWDVSCYVNCYDKHLFGSASSGKVYSGSLDVFTVDGNEQIATLIFPPVQIDGDRFRVNSVQLDMEAGVGEITTDPKVMLQTSKDGKTWSNETWVGFGAQGNGQQRAAWNRLGQYRTCHFKFSISDPVKRAVYTAYAQMSRDAG